MSPKNALSTAIMVAILLLGGVAVALTPSIEAIVDKPFVQLYSNPELGSFTLTKVWKDSHILFEEFGPAVADNPPFISNNSVIHIEGEFTPAKKPIAPSAVLRSADGLEWMANGLPNSTCAHPVQTGITVTCRYSVEVPKNWSEPLTLYLSIPTYDTLFPGQPEIAVPIDEALFDQGSTM